MGKEIIKKQTPTQLSPSALSKLFLAILLPVLTLIGGITTALVYTDFKTNRTVFEIIEVRNVELQKEIITRDFKSVISDLMILSEGNELQEMLGCEVTGQRQALAEEFLSVSQWKGRYDQIRFLDETGMEVVRVNFIDGEPVIVPEEQLQSKRERYYFKDTIGLEPGEVFVSPFDLNIEQGEIEQPPKPIIRFGTPVFDCHGRKRGIVMLNYFGGQLIHHLERGYANAPSQGMLLNAEGFWLHGPKTEDEWGFMVEDRSTRTFGNAFPEVWPRISGAEWGQFVTSEGMFTFATVYPLLEAQAVSQGVRITSSTGSSEPFEPSTDRIEAKTYYWKIVSHILPEVLHTGWRNSLGDLLLIFAVVVVTLAIGSWYLTRAIVSRQQAEKALKEYTERLEEMVDERSKELGDAQDQLLRGERLAAMGQLAGGVAHELRNPLGVISNAIYLLHSVNPQADDISKEYLDMIADEVRNAEKIVKEMLDYSRRKLPNKENVTVAGLVSRVLERHPPPPNIEINVCILDDLPRLFVDSTHIIQVLSNLVTNAYQSLTSATSNQPPRIGKLTVEARMEGDKTHLSVSDNGIGISRENMKKIFEPLFTTKSRGIGLGLTVSKDLVEANGGWIEVESEEGEGSIFTVILPTVGRLP